MLNPITLEICIDSVESANAAQKGGAHRVELCENLTEGGTTPSEAMIKLVRKKISIDLHVMIRPRGGNFVYSELEFGLMEQDIAIVKELGVEGVVFGLLLPDGAIDVNRTLRLVELSDPMNVTFHRAFDVANDPYLALENVIDAGADFLLTSGQRSSAMEGVACISKLVKQANGRIVIMAGAGITAVNVREVVRKTGISEIHVGTGVTGIVHSAGDTLPAESGGSNIVDAEKVRRLLYETQR